MSLPTKAIFTMKGKEVFKGFANIGWFYRDDLIPDLFYEMICEKQFPHANTWDEVKLYGKTYQYNDVLQMIRNVHKKRERNK